MRLSKNDQELLAEAYTKMLEEADRKPLIPDPALEKFNKRQKSPTSQWKSNPAARGIVVWLKDLKSSEEISSDELFDATEGLKAIKAEGGIVIYRAEEYIVVITGNN